VSIGLESRNYYPLMKLVDMHFWQIDYETEAKLSA
jgi:hypothetical protein